MVRMARILLTVLALALLATACAKKEEELVLKFNTVAGPKQPQVALRTVPSDSPTFALKLMIRKAERQADFRGDLSGDAHRGSEILMICVLLVLERRVALR